MLNKKEFIQLLEQEVEDFIQTQAEKIVSFEDDPKEFILQKYPSLKGTLQDLMTTSFDEYITGIFVMAPKPTTFKVLPAAIACVVDDESLKVKPPAAPAASLIAATNDDFALVVKLAKSPVSVA